MSEVAGRMAVQAGAYFLEKTHGGLGVLLGGVPGVDPGKVLVLGGGVVGTHAIHIALGMGADVWVIDRDLDQLRRLWRQFGRPLNTVYSTRHAIEKHVLDADLVIGGVLIPGAEAPKLVTADLVRRMKPGAVVVDVAIDQGGCFETSHPTTHDQPTYVVDDVIHYCVANMPGGVPRTSTFALNNATLPFVLALADKGARRALLDDPHLLNGLNLHAGQVTHPAVADALGLPFVEPRRALG
jgi:alanine dehydrogenase